MKTLSILDLFLEILSNKYGKNTSSYKTSISLIRTFLKDYSKVNSSIKLTKKEFEKILLRVINSKKSNETKRKIIFIISLLIEKIGKSGKLKNYTIILEKYRKTYREIKDKIIQNRKSNKPRSVKEAECLNISLDELRQREIDLSETTQNMNPKIFLYNILIFLDKTPRLELRKLVYNPNANLLKKNYLICKNDVCEIILNIYKTSKTYKEWKMIIQGRLREYVIRYILFNKMKPDQNFFINSKKKIYPSNKFSEYIQNIFNKRIGVKISINCLRKIKEKQLFHQNPKFLKMSVKEREQYVIDTFRHNLNTSMVYYHRINDANNDANKYINYVKIKNDKNINENVFKFTNELNMLIKKYGIKKNTLKWLINSI